MNPRNTEDRGTILESTDGIRPRPAVGTAVESAPVVPPPPAPVASPVHEFPFRPVVRPPVPRLVLLDDGDQMIGEVVRLRDGVTLIGRSEGHVTIPHDPLVSLRHAEIVRDGSGRVARWVLRDLSSANGTFVRCGRALLRPDRLLMIGSRRLRFRPADDAVPAAGAQAGTVLADVSAPDRSAWPALVETAQNANGRSLVLSGTDVFLGRRGCGNAIELDDPQLASRHARVFRGATGAWTIEALPSLNGVWVQVVEVELASPCRFQIGEQRFVFVV